MQMYISKNIYTIINNVSVLSPPFDDRFIFYDPFQDQYSYIKVMNHEIPHLFLYKIFALFKLHQCVIPETGICFRYNTLMKLK